LAAILQVETPSGNIGHVRKQVADPFLVTRQPNVDRSSTKTRIPK
jgi:hypothetical protein